MDRSSRELVENSIDFVEVVGRVVYLEEDGEIMRGCCPFHKDTANSFEVIPGERMFRCAVCNLSGGIFEFIKHLRNVSIEEAFNVVRLTYNIPVKLSEKEKGLEPLYDLSTKAAELFHKNLLNTMGAPYEYLKQRGVSDVSIIRFKIGYAPNEWDFITSRLGNGGPEKKALLEEAGLALRAQSDESRYYDRFRDRIIFPFFTIDGRVVGFTGRQLNNEITTAKYVNSPETPIFKKRECLFGLNLASRAIKDTNEAVVVEGPMDVIISHQKGLENVVAACSSNFTDEHVRLAQRRYQNATWFFCFDGDEAGRAASLRSAGNMLGKVNGKIVLLPKDKDPDEIVLAEGTLAPYLKKAKPLFDFFYDGKTQGANLTTLEGKLQVIDSMKEGFRSIPPHRAGLFVDELARRLSCDAEYLAEAMQITGSARRSRGTTEREIWETTAIRQVLAEGPKLETIAYLRDVLQIDPRMFSMAEARAACYVIINALDSEPADLLNLRGTELFGETWLIEQCRLEQCKSGQRPLDEKKIRGFFEKERLYRHSPGLEEIEYSILMIVAYNMPARITRAHRQGHPFGEIYQAIQGVPS